MSYSVKIAFADGKPVVEAFSGTAPEGALMVSGHSDPTNVSIGVSLNYADGKAVISAYSTRSAS